MSGGRFLFGIGGGWNQEEMEDHGTVFATRFKKMREQIEAMKAIWTEYEAGISRRHRQFRHDDDLAEAGAEAAPAGHRRRHVPACRPPAPLRYGDGWIPHSRRPQYEDVTDFLPQFRADGAPRPAATRQPCRSPFGASARRSTG